MSAKDKTVVRKECPCCGAEMEAGFLWTWRPGLYFSSSKPTMFGYNRLRKEKSTITLRSSDFYTDNNTAIPAYTCRTCKMVLHFYGQK